MPVGVLEFGNPRSDGPLASDTLQIRFDSHEALRSEFEKNIANRGIFVATEEPFEVRQTVTVEVVLDYDTGRLDGRAVEIALDGEVVHCVPAEMAASGATPGVAVQFDASAQSLRDRFEPLLGSKAVADLDRDSAGKKRRAAKRGAVRVPIRIVPLGAEPIQATTRDLSATGVLLSLTDVSLAVGDVVRIHLWHPTGQPRVELDGQVARHVSNKSGQLAAVAIAFNGDQAQDPEIRSVVEALREAGHRSRLGGISGSLSDLGLANMLQMFGASAPRGTLVVEFEGEQGWIAFAEEQLVAAEVAGLTGHDALVRMLGWGDGEFQFEASVDERVLAGGPTGSLAGAVLEAVCELDQAGRENPASETPAAGATAQPAAPDPDETEVDPLVDVEPAEELELALEVEDEDDEEFILVVGDDVEAGVEAEGAIEDDEDLIDVSDVVAADDPSYLDAEHVEEAGRAGVEIGVVADDDDSLEIEFEELSGSLADEPGAPPEEAVDWAAEAEPEVISVESDTTFAVDSAREEATRASRDKTQEAILELASAGMDVERFFEIIPEPEDEVQTALVGLIEQRVLRPR